MADHVGTQSIAAQPPLCDTEPTLMPLHVHVDDRGFLFEAIHNYDLPRDHDGHITWCYRFGQTYVVRTPAYGTVRAFHRHERLWDFFTCIRGRAQVMVTKMRDTFTPQELIRLVGGGKVLAPDALWKFILTAEQPARLTIPPGLFHGWMALDDETTLLCTGTEVYTADMPDEVRIPWNAFGESLWGVGNR